MYTGLVELLNQQAKYLKHFIIQQMHKYIIRRYN